MVLQHRVDWDPGFMQRSPWFWPLARAAAALHAPRDWPTRSALDAMYAQCARDAVATLAPLLRFADNVRKQDRSDGARVQLERLYDGRIALLGEVPTRERDWHDLFNALCFATFPRAKHALHMRQFRVLQARIAPGASALPPTRTREQDALTLFDEGGAVVAAEAAVVALLQRAAPDARGGLLAQCSADGSARVVPFGHALFEHLVEGLRCPGGSTRLLRVESLACDDATLVDAVDRGLSTALTDRAQFLTPAEGAHLRLDALGLGRS